VIPPGTQTKYINTMDTNEKYYGYSSTMSFILFDRINNQLNSVIDSKMSNSYLKSAALSQGQSNLDIASLYYSKTNYIIIFDIQKEAMKNIYNINHDIVYQEYNKSNYLLILFENNTLGLITNSFSLQKSEEDKNVDIIQTNGKVVSFQWYPFCTINENTFCYCNTDNEIYYINLNNDKKYESKISLNHHKEYKGNKIVNVQWYISDENYKYILVGFDTSDICLCDMSPNNTTVITKFERNGKNLNKLLWIKNEPGLFMAFYNNSSKICIYNVSSSNVKSVTKFTDKNITNCLLLTNPVGSENKLLLSLTDGTLQIYDLNNKKMEKNVTKGHSGTIFDLKFSPFLEGILATCSIDGTIKIWNIYNEKKNVTLVSSNRGIIKEESKSQIISIKWSPIKENEELLLCGDSKNSIKIWDITKQKVISQLNLNVVTENKNANSNNTNTKSGNSTPNNLNKNFNVIGLDWNEENTILATCNIFVFIINFIANKLILKDVINLHTKAFKIEFSPYSSDKKTGTFAVACFDWKIRIYEISKIKQSVNITPSKVLIGHKNQIFGLSYKPLINNIDKNKHLLASGSDDYRVGIWDLSSQEPKAKFLLGHTDKVRNVVWFKEENMLISGSWDGIAFIWDINYYICVSIINQHKSDIYGIDTNINYPYLFATSSRDCSIIILNYVNNPIKIISLYKSNNYNENNLIKEKHPKLYNELKNVENNDNISKAEIISKYFLSYPCIKEFYDIIKIIMHKSEHSTDNNKIFHAADLYSAYKSKILKIEFDYNNKPNNFGQNDINKKNLIFDAIMKCAAINDWEKFCELNILINNWKKALMFAPKVSKKYWEDLIFRYNKYLKEKKGEAKEDKNSNELDIANNKLLYGILESSISKDIKEPFDILLKGKEYKNCLLLYIRNIINKNDNKKEKFSMGNFFNQPSDEDRIIDLINKIKNNENNENFYELMKIINLLVKERINESKIIEAVCILLSVNQIILSIKLLIGLDQYELAYYLMDISQNYLYEDIIYINLMKNSIKSSKYNNHIELINICPNKKIKILLYKLMLNSNIKLEGKEEKEYNELITNAKKDYNNDKEMDIFLKLNNNYKDSLTEIVNKYYDILLEKIFDENINIEALTDINALFNILRIYNFNFKLNSNKKTKENTHKKILLIIIFLETLNKNCTSVKSLIDKFLKFSKVEEINELDENEKIIVSLGNDFYKSINNESLFNINFNLHLTLRKNVNLKKIQNNFNTTLKENQYGYVNSLNRFNCDLENKFYFHHSSLKNKILEMNKYIQIIDEINDN